MRISDWSSDVCSSDLVEVVGRRGAVHHLHIVLGAELQIALDAGGGVLRPLPLVAMRQQHDDARQPQPLRLARGDELVDDNLRAVGEVAELRLPGHQRARIGQRIAILERTEEQTSELQSLMRTSLTAFFFKKK